MAVSNPLINYQIALHAAVTEAQAPGAAAYVGTMDQTLFHGAAGSRQRVPRALPARADTIYDLASLTKVVATTTAVMQLHEKGKIDLDAPVSTLLPLPLFRRFTPRQLLTHTAGLPGYRAYYKEITSLEQAIQRISEETLRNEAIGRYRTYSDLGFMILGKLVELASGESLSGYCQKHIFQPLEMGETQFQPPESLWQRCAPTEDCAWRDRIVLGQVHDENAFAVGGVSGHAGLFSTAGDLGKFCRGLLGGKLVSEKTLDDMTRLGQVPSYPWQGLGWKLDPWEEGSEGWLPARTAFGHTGWTGTSIWMDRGRGVFGILLSNTAHPSRTDRDNRELRQSFYHAIAVNRYPRQTNAHTGLDRTLWDGFDVFEGKRLGLLTHHAAVDELGRFILDVFRLYPDKARLVRLFSPEHGLAGQAEAGAKVGGQQAPVPVTSLYGERRAPTREELNELDLFVIDLQDVGSRYYTYISTMKECMEACNAANKPVMILDRPNPVGGSILEGPIATNTGSFVCSAAVPIRHGMTMGEMALWFKKEHFPRLSVSVQTVDSWPREFMWDDTSLPWVPPSPNIPTPMTALAYVGTCLFEGTNLNEGRGTDAPFLLIGSPWLNSERIIARVSDEAAEGFALKPETYTPRAIPGKASNPRFEGEQCQGIRLEITDKVAARPFKLTLALIQAMREEHGNDFAFKSFFDTLAGGPWLRQQLEAGRSAQSITLELVPALAAYDKARPRLYDLDQRAPLPRPG